MNEGWGEGKIPQLGCHFRDYGLINGVHVQRDGSPPCLRSSSPVSCLRRFTASSVSGLPALTKSRRVSSHASVASRNQIKLYVCAARFVVLVLVLSSSLLGPHSAFV